MWIPEGALTQEPPALALSVVRQSNSTRNAFDVSWMWHGLTTAASAACSPNPNGADTRPANEDLLSSQTHLPVLPPQQAVPGYPGAHLRSCRCLN